MRKIGLTLPLILLVTFAVLYHPSVKLSFLRYFPPQAYFLTATILILWIRNVPHQQIGIIARPLRKNIFIGLFAGAIPYGLMSMADIIIGKIHPITPQHQLYEITSWMMFSYFVFAPITEELFFRGVIFHALKENYSMTIAIVASSFLFAASHSVTMSGPLMMGLIAAMLTQYSKSLLPGMIFHALSNGLPWFYANHCPNLHPFEKWIFFRF